MPILEKRRGHHIAASTVLILVAGYTIAIILGLSKDRRIDATTLGLIGIGSIIAFVLFRPEVIDRVTHVEIAGWKVDIEKRQEKQDRQLKDIELILPILLPETERKHLLNLANSEEIPPYTGNHAVRSELRRLRFLNLIRMKPTQRVAGMKDGERFDLNKYVELTELGQQWAARLKEIEAESSKPSEPITGISSRF